MHLKTGGDRLNPILAPSVRCERNGRNFTAVGWSKGANTLNQGIPILAGHADIADKNIEFTSLEQPDCFVSRLGCRNDRTVIFQDAFEQCASICFVVHHEYSYAFNLNVDIPYADGRKARVTTFGPRVWVVMDNRQRQGDGESGTKSRSIAFDSNLSTVKLG
jgi:hypothetical protein